MNILEAKKMLINIRGFSETQIKSVGDKIRCDNSMPGAITAILSELDSKDKEIKELKAQIDKDKSFIDEMIYDLDVAIKVSEKEFARKNKEIELKDKVIELMVDFINHTDEFFMEGENEINQYFENLAKENK
jgi:hypothetical protein